MKKISNILLSFLLIIASVGCNSNNIIEEEIPTITDDVVVERDEYIDNNPIKIATYQANNSNFYKVSEVNAKLAVFKDAAVFYIFYCDDELLPRNRTVNIYESCKSRYENNNMYKTGIRIMYTYDNMYVVDKTLTRVEDWMESNQIVFIYFYDAVYHRNDSWFSHTKVSEFNENSNITSIKITGGDYVQRVTSDIYITVFTYKDENDFDHDGNYRGNSKHTVVIKRT